MPGSLSHKIFPISDTALTIDFGNVINENINSTVLSLSRDFQNNPQDGFIETIPAYSSLTVYYDVFQLSKSIPQDRIVYEWVSSVLEERLQRLPETVELGSPLFEIPVRYDPEFAPDIGEIANLKAISTDEVMHIHRSKEYRVYMLGFLPGFSYMGEVDERIAVPRKSQPKQVAAGSIGIAGRQTGIYPSASPGGWQVIGRTPLKIFDPKKEEPTLLKAGDRVRFIPISKHEFENY